MNSSNLAVSTFQFKISKLLIIIFVICITTNVFAEEFYPTSIAELKSEVIIYGFGEITGLREGQVVDFQTITFPNSSFQKIQVIKEILTINGNKIYPTYSLDEFENKYVNFKINENGEFRYELIAEVDTQALIHEINDYNIIFVSDALQSFIQKSEKVESDSTQILTLTRNKLIKNSFLESLTSAIFWTNDYVEYASGAEFNKYYLLQRSAVETLIDKKGVCDEFSNLAAAMLRAKGIPTRLAIGITFDGKEWGNHAWLEVHHKDFGWIPSDPTFREPGFVDATHIRLGSFNDVSQSVAKATYPSNANVKFQTQTLPKVTVKSKKFFSHIALTAKETEFKTNQWNELEITVKNLTNATLIVPIKIRENYDKLIIKEKTLSTVLTTGEEKKLVFNIYPNITLGQNEIAKGILTIDSLTEPKAIDFTITPHTKLDNGEVTVIDVTPIAFEEDLKLELNIGNYQATDANIYITIITPDGNLYWNETLKAFTKKVFSKEISSYEERKYTVIIKTPTETYTQQIIPIKSKVQVIQTPIDPIIIQKNNLSNNIQSSQLFSDTNIVVFGILIAITAIAILLMYLLMGKRKYV
jgi:hypothetical protein